MVTEPYGTPHEGAEQPQTWPDETKLVELWSCSTKPIKKGKGSNAHFGTPKDVKAKSKVTIDTKVVQFEHQGVINEVNSIWKWSITAKKIDTPVEGEDKTELLALINKCGDVIAHKGESLGRISNGEHKISLMEDAPVIYETNTRYHIHS